jgi:hypothetical protein
MVACVLDLDVLTVRRKERLAKEWTAPIYAFFQPVPQVRHIDGRRCHTFLCAAKACLNRSREVNRYLDKGDRKSTSNMRKHAKKCWGDDVVKHADAAKDAAEVRQKTVAGVLNPQSITVAFARKAKDKVTYMHRQHTTTETRAEIVRWVSESVRPFEIVKDRGFQTLMKTGCPEYHIPSPSTVSRDVKKVFVKARKRIANMLQVLSSSINLLAVLC